MSEVDDLVKLLFLDSLLSKTSERELAKKCVPTTTEEHFQLIYEVSNRVHYSKNSRFKGNKTDLLNECLATANYWVNESRRSINETGNISYCDLLEQARLIISSEYMEQISEPYDKCNIGIFWDLQSCPLPTPASYNDFRGKIDASLKKMGFSGQSYFWAFGDIEQLRKEVKNALSNQAIRIVQCEQERVGAGTKDTTEKHIIVNMLRWVYTYLSANNEGGVVVVITGDEGLRFAIEDLREKKIRVVVVHNKRPSDVEDQLLREHAFAVIYLADLLK